MDNCRAVALLEQCNFPEVQERKYWLVRTDSGVHYDDFVINNYIAIGWDYITKEMFERKTETDIKSIILSQERVSPTQKDDEDDLSERGIAGRVTSVYNKLNRFICEFSEGDVVVIPSKNTERVSIGVITGPVKEDSNYVSNYLDKNPETEISLCPYKKRRAVNWVKNITKNQIDVYLIKAFSSHHAISDISEYADYINRELYSIYRTNDSIHSIIRAGHPCGMNLNELKSLIDLLEGTMQETAQATGIPYDPNKIQVKLNIHSPGIIEIVTALGAIGVLVAISMLTWNHVKNGGKLKVGLKIGDKIDFSAEAESPGIEGRKIEAQKLEYDHQIKEFVFSQEQKLRELSYRLDMTIPEISLKNEVLSIEPENPVDKS